MSMTDEFIHSMENKNKAKSFIPVEILLPSFEMKDEQGFNREQFFATSLASTAESPKPTPPKNIVNNADVELDVDVTDENEVPDEIVEEKDVVQEMPNTTVKPMTTPIKSIPLKQVVSAKSKKPSKMKASLYYMNNRQKFGKFITDHLRKYKKHLKAESAGSCDRDQSGFSLMTHQRIVRDYISTYTPYRGVMLYHGLGSGKTCSSIAIAEGMKSDKQVIVMTPASLRTNYYEELKKCGDIYYRSNHHWTFQGVKELAEAETFASMISLSVEFIHKMKGAWFVDMNEAPNYDTLSETQQRSLDQQIDYMIQEKYRFINYNGMRRSHLDKLTMNYQQNPFDNKVVIIDESHNFVSRIVNKLGREGTLSGALYELLMSAQNAKIVMLTGTPIINYPNEIAIACNILRGYITTFTFALHIKKSQHGSKEYIEKLVTNTHTQGKMVDYVDFKPKTNTLTITRNPFGFVSRTRDGKHGGVEYSEQGDIDDDEFLLAIRKILTTKTISIVPGSIKVSKHKALPDNLKDFRQLFIDQNNEVKNMEMFKRRIVGLPSFFRDMTALMPRYDRNRDLRIVKIPMSDYQFGTYEGARAEERKLEKNNTRNRKKKAANTEGMYEETVSTYRIFSRAFCNFVFPKEIVRPLPGNASDLESAIVEERTGEDQLDAVLVNERRDNVDGQYEADDVDKIDEDIPYLERLQESLTQLYAGGPKFLSPEALAIYSPKFLNILENLRNPQLSGLHLVYSHFRTMEGIGILELVLQANGFARFKLLSVGGRWSLDLKEEDRGKPLFALYTGTESPEEKELVRNIFNSNWDQLPAALADELRAIHENNLYGNVIKTLMITASGAEGISLKNVRYVHITEPYWHPVRIHQVIGRARRLCSHQDLPKDLQTVEVFLYLMTFSKEQLEGDEAIDLKLNDKSKLNGVTPVTSDEALYEIAMIKEKVNTDILKAVKEASFDCMLHADAKTSKDDAVKCFTFGTDSASKYAYLPTYADEENDEIIAINKREMKFDIVEHNINGVIYALKVPIRKKQAKIEMYDIDSVYLGDPHLVGHLMLKEGTTDEYNPVFIEA